MIDLVEQIKVNGFLLCPLKATFENANMIYDIFAQDMQNLRFWIPNTDYKNPGDVFMVLKTRERSVKQCMYGIYKDKEFLGEIGITGYSDVNKYAIVGYWLKASARGFGTINKVLPAIEKIAFQKMDINKLKLNCDVQNIASRKIAEANGYKLDGIMRGDRVWPDGSVHDCCEYSKLRLELAKGK
ncbi:MAG: GNAT family N-acetyltransferase [Alphaproteobacteria bacterium]|nr:GNAT family N-acetyltransferase [Alphaproteobacteria bacterium]